MHNVQPWTATRIPVSSLAIDDLLPQPDVALTMQALGKAVRLCRTERAITQEQVAERTGIGQTTLSAYERGASAPTALGVNQIERACGRPDGWIVIQAGLIAEVRTVPEAIAVDPLLIEVDRRQLLAAYAGAADRRLAGNNAGDDGQAGL